MGFWASFKSAWSRFWNSGRPTVSLQDKELAEWLGIDTATNADRLSEVTYFTCLKMLSETIGKLPIRYYQVSTMATGIYGSSGS